MRTAQPPPRCCLIRTTALALALMAAVGSARGQAQAQDAPERDAPPPGRRVPPRALELAPIELPRDTPGESVEVLVVVATDGSARLEACEHPDPVCEAIDAALVRSRFAPATLDGAPIAARVTVRLHAESAGAPGGGASPPAAAAPRVPRAREPPSSTPRFRARARAADLPSNARRFTLAQIRDVPGAFGDPLRAIESLPGVVPIVSGLPYVFVRGSPPAGTLYAYDGIPLPQLFHLALGPSVVHPRMLGAIQLHAGVAPSEWGRHIGGVILAEGPDDEVERALGEIEVRLLDVNGYVEARIGERGSVAGALRVGWPGLIASAAVPSLELYYGDYQLRATIPVGSQDLLQVVALGSFDRMGWSTPEQTTALEMQFHRLEVRAIRRAPGVELLSALRIGYDASWFGSGISIRTEAGHVAPRITATVRDPAFVLRVGADAIATFGPPAASFALGALLNRAPSFARSMASAWVELALRLDPSLILTLGGRFDVWISDFVEGAIDPRVRLTWHPLEGLTLHASAGVTRQPPTLAVPIPGTNDAPILPGLQTAMQAEVGASYERDGFRAELQLFLHRYEDLVFSDFFVLLGTQPVCDPLLDVCEPVFVESRTDGLSWGGELLLSIAPDQPVSGWLSYTLSWAEVDPIAGVALRPSYDIRHVANLVMRWELGAGFSLGARIHVRSGSAHGVFYADFREEDAALRRHERELPGFFRGDAQFAYAWTDRGIRLRFVLEWLNVTIAEEAVGLGCGQDANGLPTRCEAQYAPPIFAPNIGLRMEL